MVDALAHRKLIFIILILNLLSALRINNKQWLDEFEMEDYPDTQVEVEPIEEEVISSDSNVMTTEEPI